MPFAYCSVLRFSTHYVELDDLAALLARVSLGITWHFCKYTRVGRVPTSYPTVSTRRLMGPIADARTDQKVYADCHRDYRITGIIYINGVPLSRESLRVADGIVQQGHLRVRKHEKFVDGGNVHRHARASHQAHAGTDLPPIFAGAGNFWSWAMASVLQMSVAISVSTKRFFMGYSLWFPLKNNIPIPACFANMHQHTRLL